MGYQKHTRFLKRFAQSERGTAGVVMAVAAPVLVGLSGLAVDYGMWKKEQTSLERTAQSAAMAAAYAKGRGATDLNGYAAADAARNGLDASASLSLTSEAGVITVNLSQPSERFLSSLFLHDDILIAAQANAELVEKEVEGEPVLESAVYACVTALQANPETDRGIYLHNTAEINVTNCKVHSNATDVAVNNWTEKSSIYVRNGSITADEITAVGEVVINDWNGLSTTSVDPVSGVPVFEDPFASMAPPVQGTCSNNGHTVNYVPSPEVLQPGTYCGDIIIQNGGKASFAPGLYNIINGDLLVRGGATIFDSEDVTFYFGGNTPGKWIIDNGTNVSLSAPSSGDTAGMLFWQSPNASCSIGYNGQNKFAGGAEFQFDGVIYSPNCPLIIDNNAHLAPAHAGAHMSVHAAWIEMRGSAMLTAYGADAPEDLVQETNFTNGTIAVPEVVTVLTPQLRF